jgi:hypothetical protein
MLSLSHLCILKNWTFSIFAFLISQLPTKRRKEKRKEKDKEKFANITCKAGGSIFILEKRKL